MTEQLAIINDYTDDQLDALEDFELEDLDTAFKAGGDDALAWTPISLREPLRL